MTTTLTVGGLFSGIGGMELGLQRAGMQIRWMVEINPFCQQVLAKHWPDVERFGDVRDCGQHNLATVDLIAGGFPCQPHSIAGKQRGAEDDRNLWPEYRRIIAELRPAYVLAENVPGIRTTILDEVLSDLDDLAYSTRTLIIPACALNAPHRRERIFIVAHAQSQRKQKQQSVPDCETLVSTSIGTSCGISGGDSAARIRKHRGIAASSAQNVAHTNSTRQPQSEGCIEEQRRWTGNGCEDMAHANQGRRDGRSGELRERWQREPTNSSRRIPEPSVDRTLDGISAGLDGTLNFWAGDWERGISRTARGVPNRTNRVKALGNAVVPQVVEWIGRRIVEVEQL